MKSVADERDVERLAAFHRHNFGGDSGDVIKAMVGQGLKVHYEGVQKGDVRHTFADMTKAEEELGYQPKVSIQEGLEREYEWMKGFVG